jgi:hypothetical protein
MDLMLKGRLYLSIRENTRLNVLDSHLDVEGRVGSDVVTVLGVLELLKLASV